MNDDRVEGGGGHGKPRSLAGVLILPFLIGLLCLIVYWFIGLREWDFRNARGHVIDGVKRVSAVLERLERECRTGNGIFSETIPYEIAKTMLDDPEGSFSPRAKEWKSLAESLTRLRKEFEDIQRMVTSDAAFQESYHDSTHDDMIRMRETAIRVRELKTEMHMLREKIRQFLAENGWLEPGLE